MKFPYIMLTALYCAGIFWLSSQPKPLPTAPRFPGADKVAHAVLYAGLAGVVSIGLRRRDRPVTPRVQFFVPILFATAYGLSDEIHQLYVPERSFELLDLAADAAGAFGMQLFLCSWVWKPLPAATQET